MMAAAAGVLSPMLTCLAAASLALEVLQKGETVSFVSGLFWLRQFCRCILAAGVSVTTPHRRPHRPACANLALDEYI